MQDAPVSISATRSSGTALTVADWIRDRSPPGSLPLDQEAARVLERARAIGLDLIAPTQSSDPPVSFTSLFAALMADENEACRWFGEQAKASGLVSHVLKEKKISPNTLEPSWKPSASGAPAPSSSEQWLTRSARTVLRNAEGWAQRVGGSDIGVRHLLAAYLVNPPPDHGRQMEAWQFYETAWRDKFFDWVIPLYQWEQWGDARQKPAPTRRLSMVGQAGIAADSLVRLRHRDAVCVLEEAAQLHARATDQRKWLRVRTLFCGLIEAATKDASLQHDIQPIWQAIARDREPYRSQRALWYFEAAEEPARPFERLQISPRVLNALATARELAALSTAPGSATGADSALQVRAVHLAGALLSQRVDASDDLASLGLDLPSLRSLLRHHAVDVLKESEDVWREALGETEPAAPSLRPVELNSDDASAIVGEDTEWASDPLAIRADVLAFAELLASRKLEPPLSIGLFGPWGSGKTTFLHRLRQTVDRVVEANGDAASAYVSNVVHVQFNAWHFAEGALVSSLVDTIFRRLADYANAEPAQDGQPLLDAMRTAVEAASRQVEAAVRLQDTAKTTVEAAEREFADRSETAAKKLGSLRSLVSNAWTQARAELAQSKVVQDSGVLEQLGDTVANAEQLRARVAEIRSRPARMLSALGRAKSLAFAASVLVLPPALAWLTGKLEALQGFGQTVSLLAGMVTTLGLWLQSAAKAAASVDAALGTVADRFEQSIARDPNVEKATAQLERARLGAATAQATLEAARGALARAEMEKANASLPAQLLRLVSGRIEDKTYEKELTTLSLARADLERLSRNLRDQRRHSGPVAVSNGKKPLRRVERVILYVDDLDRCEPKKVVEVLRTLHMLLAFDLFVVVVAVDARWVEEALVHTYPWLDNDIERRDPSAPAVLAAPHASTSTSNGAGAGHTSPFSRANRTGRHGSAGEYLEKIFQIAFWLEPMAASRAASYLESLVRPALAVRAAPGTIAPPAAASLSAGVADGSDARGSSAVDIGPLELDYMRALASYVGPSPRSVKRLVNSYRLIKVRLSTAQLEAFVRSRPSGDGPYQIVIAVLVIGTGAQLEAAAILGALAEWDPTDSYSGVVEGLRRHETAEWAHAARVIETLARTQGAANVAELRGWARKVGRFLLGGPLARSPRPASRAAAIGS